MYYEEKYGTVKLTNADYSAYIDKYHYFNKRQLKKAFTRLKKKCIKKIATMISVTLDTLLDGM